MKKLHFVLLLLVLGYVAAAAKVETSYTIEFRTGSKSSLPLSSSLDKSAYISSGEDYVSSISNIYKTYYAETYGLRMGSGADPNGTLNINLSTAGRVKVKRYVVKVAQFSESAPAAVSINGDMSLTTTSSTPVERTITPSTTTTVSTLSIGTNGRRISLQSITVYYDTDKIDTPTPKPDQYIIDGIIYEKSGSNVKVVGCLDNITNVIIPDRVIIDYNHYKVAEIADGAFKGKDIKSVEIGYNVKKLPDQVFGNCDCLESVIFKGPLELIGEYAFYGCYSLESITLPSSLRSIGLRAFFVCDNLMYIKCDAPTPPICSLAVFDYKIEQNALLMVPDESSYSKADQWKDFSNINGYRVRENELVYKLRPDTNTGICIGPDENSVKSLRPLPLKSQIVYKDKTYTITTIADNAFKDCSRVGGMLTIPATITKIGTKAFQGCTDITEIINKSINPPEIDYDTFSGLDENVIPVSVPAESYETYCSSYRWSKFKRITATYVVDGILYLIYNINSAKCEGPLTTSGKYDNYAIKGFYINGTEYNVTSISAGAFKNCTGLTGKLTIPETVKTIYKQAFAGCTGITSVNCLAVDPPRCGSLVFDGINKETCILYVPAESLDKYKSADPWKDFYHIQAIIPEVAEIRLDKTEATIKVGEDLQLTATVLPEEAAAALTWISSDKSIATVSESGLVTAVSLGTAKITVVGGNVTATCTVEVTDKAGIDDVLLDSDQKVEVYNLQGIRLDVNTREELKQLSSGIYIINGKKVYLK